MITKEWVFDHKDLMARKDCRYCHGDGMEADYEGYPVAMPVYWDICRCIYGRIAFTEYFKRPELPQIYDEDIPF